MGNQPKPFYQEVDADSVRATARTLPQHSDAPWRFDAVPHRAGHGIEGHILPHGAVDDDPCVAYVEGVGSVDLALILAAPDLLAVLEAEYATWLEQMTAATDGMKAQTASAYINCPRGERMRTVIAKAKGA